jgi:ABC-2 type transport system ATP-binding protein
MRALIQELSQTATVIVSTHILQEVQAVCQRVLIMRAGRKVVDARLSELQRDTRLLVTLDADEPAALPVLRALQGVQSVTLLDVADGRYRYCVEAAESLAPAIGAAAVHAGFAQHALVREARTLETVFAQVNAGAAATEARDAA